MDNGHAQFNLRYSGAAEDGSVKLSPNSLCQLKVYALGLDLG